MHARPSASILAALIAFLVVPPMIAVAQSSQTQAAFTLTSLGNGRVSLSWPAGLAPSLVGTTWSPVRITTKGRTPIARASDTSAFDTLPAGITWACYQIEGQVTNGSSFVRYAPLCALPRVANGSAPLNLKITFDATCSGAATSGSCPQGWGTAFLTWDPAPGATSYLLVPVGTQRTQALGGMALGATDNPNEQLACYVVIAFSADHVVGYSDAVCGTPPTG